MMECDDLISKCIPSQKEYAQEIATRLTDMGLFADVDNGADTLPKKIRNGEIAQYNFILGETLLHCTVPPHSWHMFYSGRPRRT
jgi:hypothetical protein